jgi:hypothetical protein
LNVQVTHVKKFSAIYDPANILQSVEYRHNSSQPKTFKEQALTQKVMNALLDKVLTQFVEKGTE